MKFFRGGFRFCSALIIFLLAYLDFIFRIKLRGRASALNMRAEWLQFWVGRLLRKMRVDVEWEGKPPSHGLMASNHLSYVDIFVYASICPLVFVSKSEVRSWPVAGTLTRCAGTLYLVRQSKTDLMRLRKEMEPIVSAGMPVTLFLEGTSSDGSEVLPFRSSLLAPAEEHGWPVMPAWISYSMPEGVVEQDVCYWGDMTFFPHFWKLLGQKEIQAHVRFGEPVTKKMTRKELAHELHARVCDMKKSFGAKKGS